MSFHDVLFPAAISRGSQGGPERRTDVVVLGSGHEQRNSRWADSRRSYNAGYGVRNLADIDAVVAFFEERRGRLHGFRWKDHADFASAVPGAEPAAGDQQLGIGTGTQTTFQVIKTYGGVHAPYQRTIRKLVADTLLVAVNGAPRTPGTHYVADPTTGVITFLPGHIPATGAGITAGFEFDVPVRFDTDRLEINVQSVAAGSIPNIPIVEIRL